MDKPKVTCDIVELTHEMAAAMLKRNKNYRKMTEALATRFARIFAIGKYKFDGQPIRIDSNNYLIDGQHRLTGLVRAKATAWFLVVRGVDAVIDTGKPRTLQDHLVYMGEKNVRSLGGALNLFWLFKQGRSLNSTAGARASNEELIECFLQNSSIAESVSKTNITRDYCPQSLMAFLHYVISTEDVEMADKFLSEMSTSANKGVDDPVRRFQDRVIKNRESKAKLAATELLALLIKTWNFWIQGRGVSNLRYRTSGPRAEEFPRIIMPSEVNEA